MGFNGAVAEYGLGGFGFDGSQWLMGFDGFAKNKTCFDKDGENEEIAV